MATSVDFRLFRHIRRGLLNYNSISIYKVIYKLISKGDASFYYYSTSSSATLLLLSRVFHLLPFQNFSFPKYCTIFKPYLY